MKANEILRQAADVIEQRGQLRDKPDGERSMGRAVSAFNVLTGNGLSELDGWLFMSILKMARATAGNPHLDDWTDLAGYAALGAECFELKAQDRAGAPRISPGLNSVIRFETYWACCALPESISTSPNDCINCGFKHVAR